MELTYRLLIGIMERLNQVLLDHLFSTTSIRLSVSFTAVVLLVEMIFLITTEDSILLGKAEKLLQHL